MYVADCPVVAVSCTWSAGHSWWLGGSSMEEVFPVRVDDGGTTDNCETSSLLAIYGFRALYKHLAMIIFDLLVTRWREERCRCITSAVRWASCSMEQPLMSLGGAVDDIDERHQWLVIGMVIGNTGHQMCSRQVELPLKLWQTFRLG